MSPPFRRRKNLRLENYDYSRAGCYFITINVRHNLHLFGEVRGGEMILNEAGEMVHKWYDELEKKYPDKMCHEMVVMPNHFHCILENVHQDQNQVLEENQSYGIDNQKYKSPLGDAVAWFKTMTTNEYIRGVREKGWKPFSGKLWHRNYYERIIRSRYAFIRIADYIFNNPRVWKWDKFNRDL